MMKEVIDILKKTYLFDCFSKKELENILNDSRTYLKSYKEKEMIIKRGKSLHALAFIIKGSVLVKAGKNLSMRIIKEKQFFGIATMFSDEKSYTDIICNEDSEILFIKQELIEEYLFKNHKFVLKYIKFMGNRIQFLNSKINLLSNDNNETNLMSFLMDIANEKGKTFRLSLSYQELAKSLNMSRATLYRTINQLEDSQRISRKGRTITINERRK